MDGFSALARITNRFTIVYVRKMAFIILRALFSQ